MTAVSKIEQTVRNVTNVIKNNIVRRILTRDNKKFNCDESLCLKVC